MEIFDINDDLVVNLEYFKAIRRLKNDNTEIFIEIGSDTESIITNIPFDSFRDLLKRRQSKSIEQLASVGNMEKSMKQLAKFNYVPNP